MTEEHDECDDQAFDWDPDAVGFGDGFSEGPIYGQDSPDGIAFHADESPDVHAMMMGVHTAPKDTPTSGPRTIVNVKGFTPQQQRVGSALSSLSIPTPSPLGSAGGMNANVLNNNTFLSQQFSASFSPKHIPLNTNGFVGMQAFDTGLGGGIGIGGLSGALNSLPGWSSCPAPQNYASVTYSAGIPPQYPWLMQHSPPQSQMNSNTDSSPEPVSTPPPHAIASGVESEIGDAKRRKRAVARTEEEKKEMNRKACSANRKRKAEELENLKYQTSSAQKRIQELTRDNEKIPILEQTIRNLIAERDMSQNYKDFQAWLEARKLQGMPQDPSPQCLWRRFLLDKQTQEMQFACQQIEQNQCHQHHNPQFAHVQPQFNASQLQHLQSQHQQLQPQPPVTQSQPQSNQQTNTQYQEQSNQQQVGAPGNRVHGKAFSQVMTRAGVAVSMMCVVVLFIGNTQYRHHQNYTADVHGAHALKTSSYPDWRFGKFHNDPRQSKLQDVKQSLSNGSDAQGYGGEGIGATSLPLREKSKWFSQKFSQSRKLLQLQEENVLQENMNVNVMMEGDQVRNLQNLEMWDQANQPTNMSNENPQQEQADNRMKFAMNANTQSQLGGMVQNRRIEEMNGFIAFPLAQAPHLMKATVLGGLRTALDTAAQRERENGTNDEIVPSIESLTQSSPLNEGDKAAFPITAFSDNMPIWTTNHHIIDQFVDEELGLPITAGVPNAFISPPIVPVKSSCDDSTEVVTPSNVRFSMHRADTAATELQDILGSLTRLQMHSPSVAALFVGPEVSSKTM